MTAQIGDIYKHKNKEYKLVALSAKLPFDPQEFGMEPHMSSTACYRGYWCKYDVDEMLILDELYLFNRDGKYPQINGVEAEQEEFIELTMTNGKNKSKVKRSKYNHHRAYLNINLPIPYTGKILLGNGFIQDFYIHMGFQRYWAYQELIEFVFEDGILLEANDFSSEAKKAREQLKEKNTNPRRPEDGSIESFVEDCFSLDYGIKARFTE